jgi:signal peptidase II
VRVARISLFLSLILPCVACDQATKEIARRTLDDGRLVEFWNGFVRLELVENTGALLSLGSSLSEPVRTGIFLFLVPVGLAALTISLIRSHTISLSAGCGISLMIGGGIGNLIDRVFNQGAVVDFVSIGMGGLRTGIFNVSDVAIVAGALLVFLGMRNDTPDALDDPTEASQAADSAS